MEICQAIVEIFDIEILIFGDALAHRPATHNLEIFRNPRYWPGQHVQKILRWYDKNWQRYFLKTILVNIAQTFFVPQTYNFAPTQTFRHWVISYVIDEPCVKRWSRSVERLLRYDRKSVCKVWARSRSLLKVKVIKSSICNAHWSIMNNHGIWSRTVQ